ncbi:MAG: hypothetical protein AAF639_29250 [Chloroflexota bacterium]
MAQSQETKMTMHDRLFKEFFRRFLERFMWVFYPEKAARLDWSQLRFVPQEQIINFPGQAMRITDVAAVVPIIDVDEPALRTSVDDNIDKRDNKKDDEKQTGAKEEFIILHIDAEANKPKPIPKRMHEYYSLFRVMDNKPVLPIALLIRGRSTKAGVPQVSDDDGHKMQVYTERLWGRELLRFHYYEIVLQDLLSEEYLGKNDPVAAALATLMKHPKELSAFIKSRSLDIIAASGELSVGDKRFLGDFVQEYLPDEEVQGGTEEIMKQLAEHKLLFSERVAVEAQQNFLIELLLEKFHEVADDLLERIRRIEDSEILTNIGKQLFVINSPDDLQLPEPA